jgi:Fe2+ or Zn2+ uptake regulation protein
MSIHAVFERVAEQMPTTTLRTVYEVVHVLEQMALVRLLICLPGRELKPKERSWTGERHPIA